MKTVQTLLIAAIGTTVAAYPMNAPAGTCTVNGGTVYQSIDGFGMCSKWASALTSAQAATFFSTLGFSLHRCGIDATSSFTTEAANASLAHSYGAKVLGTPWSPPASMKSNGSLIGGTLNTGSYAAYATYLAGAASSIGLDYVSMQNEPDASVSYESCSWTGSTMATWCANNAPSVGKPIVMPESEGFNTSYSSPTLANSTALGHVTYIAGHLYGVSPSTYTAALNAGKHVWMTEHYYNGYDIGTCMTIAKEISDCMNDQMSAYIWWRGYHDTYASDDLVNGSTALKNGYTIGQFAKYVRPGMARIATTYNPTTSVYVTAYRYSGLVIVAINTGSSSVSQTFTISNYSGVSSLYANRTSSTENMASVTSATVSSGSFTYTLPAQSITTFHQY